MFFLCESTTFYFHISKLSSWYASLYPIVLTKRISYTIHHAVHTILFLLTSRSFALSPWLLMSLNPPPFNWVSWFALYTKPHTVILTHTIRIRYLSILHTPRAHFSSSQPAASFHSPFHPLLIFLLSYHEVISHQIISVLSLIARLSYHLIYHSLNYTHRPFNSLSTSILPKNLEYQQRHGL